MQSYEVHKRISSNNTVSCGSLCQFFRKSENGFEIDLLSAKYGRHFWLVSLSATIYACYDFAYNDRDFFSILMLVALT